MTKLVLIFDDGEEVTGIDKCLIFHNEKDATEYFLSHGDKIKYFSILDDRFSVKVGEAKWCSGGKIYWAKMPY